VIDDARPIFLQIAELIENDIARGTLREDTQAPSISDLSRFHRVNPATAAKGINELVSRGILIKRRGIGMFVAPGARGVILADRLGRFDSEYIAPLLAEAARLGIPTSHIVARLTKKGPAE
jgi:DNA-binding transcriptional regulator YhcF (GntR family)